MPREAWIRAKREISGLLVWRQGSGAQNPDRVQEDPWRIEESLVGCDSTLYIGKDLLGEEAKSMEQAAAAHTLNTTLEWWKEYTTVPPMQHADVSRRKVIAYYANSSCSACDACPRVRINSRSLPHVALSLTLPALLAPGNAHSAI